jgi:hypothetical protein
MLELTTLSGDAAVVFLAEALGRERQLTEHESRILQRAVKRGHGAFRRWTVGDDVRLMKMHKAKRRAADIAEALGRTEYAVTTRLRDLKKREKVR